MATQHFKVQPLEFCQDPHEYKGVRKTRIKTDGDYFKIIPTLRDNQKGVLVASNKSGKFISVGLIAELEAEATKIHTEWLGTLGLEKVR